MAALPQPFLLEGLSYFLTVLDDDDSPSTTWVPIHMSTELHRHFSIGPELGRGRFGTVAPPSSPASISPSSPSRRASSWMTPSTGSRSRTSRSSPSSPSPETPPSSSSTSSSRTPSISTSSSTSSPARTSSRGSPPPPPSRKPEAAAIFASLMEAITVCHQRGICHRDVKLDNVLFHGQGRLKLVDFGCAECFGDGRRIVGVVGTPYYVASEVIAGREYDEMVDIWSARVVLYAMLAGMVPLYGDKR